MTESRGELGGALLGVGQRHRDPAVVSGGGQQDAGAVGHLRIDVDRDNVPSGPTTLASSAALQPPDPISARSCPEELDLLRLAATADPVQHARIYDTLAIRLSNAGQRPAALAASLQATAIWQRLAATSRDAYLPNLATSLSNHANRLAEVGRPTEAIQVSQQALDLRRELTELNRDAYLPDHAESLAVLGHVLMQDARFGEAVAPLVEAMGFGQELPEYAQGIMAVIVDLLRRCHTEDAARVAEEFREIAGANVPDWMKEPPASSDG
ncbi:tetratricopeptide repeat protein [Actinoallomurus liliacearum]